MEYPAGDGAAARPGQMDKCDILTHYNNSDSEKQTISAKRHETEELR